MSIPWMNSADALTGAEFKYNELFRRGPFAADIGAITHSSAFRRLSNKTQVHLNPQMDYPRTRLTHSLEVAQIGAQLARIFSDFGDRKELKTYQKKTVRLFEHDFENLVTAACLAHDLGQPPFGHAGEVALNSLIQGFVGPNAYFEGNKQNIRLISRNNLTVSTAFVDSLVKYKSSTKPAKDGGVYRIEKDLLDKVTSSTETRGVRHPASILMEAADDIAYLSSDLEDARRCPSDC